MRCRWKFTHSGIMSDFAWNWFCAGHCERTRRVLQCMMELDLHLKLEKCRFATTKVEYLGMIVKPGQLAMDPVKLDGIASWPTPEKVKDVRSFLGFANFYPTFHP